MTNTVEFQGRVYDSRHGGPFDRGSADSYYHRGSNPHFFLGDTHNSPEVTADLMTPEQIAEYEAGYAYNELLGDKKSWD